MKYVNQLSKEGKLTTRPNEDRGKGEQQILKDTSLYQAAVCLQCEKKEVHRDRPMFRAGGGKA